MRGPWCRRWWWVGIGKIFGRVLLYVEYNGGFNEELRDGACKGRVQYRFIYNISSWAFGITIIS